MLTLRDVQNIVDNSQQTVGQVVYNVQHLTLVLGKIGVQGQLCLYESVLVNYSITVDIESLCLPFQ